MRHADALGATYVAILGEGELAEKTATLRKLADGAQETIPLTKVVARVRPAQLA
jgi:histidyl-tRNA synthetase